MNYINYIQHIIYSPDTYHRRFDFDLERMGKDVRQVGLVILPFIGLYRPFGFAISVGMNGVRTFSALQGALQIEGKDWRQYSVEVAKISLASLSLATTLFNFSFGLSVTTGVDTAQSAANAYQLLSEKKYAKAIEETLQTLASIAYLSFMFTGALEAMLTFALLQALLSLYQGRREILEGRYLEGGAKFAMAMVRIYQANGYLQQIRRRNAYMEMRKIRDVFERILRGKAASHLIRHPLSSLKEKIESKDVVLLDSKGNEMHFGSHFHGNGGALVKGENLTFRTKVIDGKEVTELDFKVNHAFRNRIDEALQQLKNMNGRQMREILSLSGSHIEGISFEMDLFLPSIEQDYYGNPIGIAHKINLKGLGSILIGASKVHPNLYDRVVVQLDADRSFYELHEMLSVLNLDQAICLSTQDDIERLKMGQLFRTFFPREATPFERTEEFFSLSLDELKAKMIQKSPEMEEVFSTYYHRMKPDSIFEGKVRYRIEGLAEAAYEKGARALTAAITGAYTNEELYERVASMLRIGMLATEVRDQNDLSMHGLADAYYTGGADSVYTQLLTEKNCREKMNFYELQYQSKVRMLISLDVLEMGSYQYHTDSFGTRLFEGPKWWWIAGQYAARESILEFIQNEQNNLGLNPGHEVMLKERIDPSFFKGLVVSDKQTKLDLIDYLRNAGLIEKDRILNVSIDQFIRVGTQVTEELIC